MSTEIKSTGLLVGSGNPAGTRVKDNPSGAARPEGEARVRQDSVSVTDAASRLLEIEDKLSTMPVVNDQRVAELKQAIAEGSYRIDPQRIADKLIQFEASRSHSPVKKN